jgi:hypothetical protein
MLATGALLDQPAPRKMRALQAAMAPPKATPQTRATVRVLLAHGAVLAPPAQHRMHALLAVSALPLETQQARVMDRALLAVSAPPQETQKTRATDLVMLAIGVALDLPALRRMRALQGRTMISLGRVCARAVQRESSAALLAPLHAVTAAMVQTATAPLAAPLTLAYQAS